MEVRRNLASMLLHAVREHPRPDMLMFRKGPGEWETLSSRQVLEAVRGADGLITDYPGVAREVLAYRAGLGSVERLLTDLALAIGWRPSEEDVARETAGAPSEAG